MKRVYLNIAAFAVLATVLIGWSIATLFPIAALQDRDRITARFEEAPGLRAGYEVTYLGQAVGSVTGVELVSGASEVIFELEPGQDLPAAVDAAVRRRSAIGEPYVDLVPTPGTSPDEGPRLGDGDHIPVERTSSPIEYSDLFRSLDELVRVIDPEALRTVVAESAAAVDGRGDDIRRLVSGAHDLVTTASENGDQISAFVDDLASIASVAATHRDALGSSIDNLSALTESLRDATPSAQALVDQAPEAVALINRLVTQTDASVVCSMDGWSVLDVALDATSAEALGRVLERSAGISTVIDGAIDDRDGYVRLMMLMSAGTPTNVYTEPKPVPVPPQAAACPERELDPPVVGESDEAAAGAGGQAPDDRPAGTPPAPGDRGSDEGATGRSDMEPEEPFLQRFIRAALPLALLAGAVAAAVYLAARRRGAAASAVSAEEVPTLPEDAELEEQDA